MGGEVYLAEYGRAKTIHFDLVEVDGVDLRVDAADGGADCIVMTDEAAEGTATNDFVDEGTGYSLVLTAAEMAGARITVYVVDSATKVWLDKAIHIETFGHQSSAHPSLSPYWTNGAVNGGTPTTTVFIVDGFTEATDDHLIGGTLIFTSGANLGQGRPISDYDDTTGTQTVTVGEAYLVAPADNDEFVILPRGASGTTDWANAGRLDTLLDAIPTTAMRGTDSAATEAKQDIIDTNVDSILVDTAVIGALGVGLTDLGGMSNGMKAEVNVEVDTAFTTQMADSVPADGTISTREQAIYAILQMLTEFAISTTTMTVKKVDGTTTLMTFTLDDGTNPTSLTRAT